MLNNFLKKKNMQLILIVTLYFFAGINKLINNKMYIPIFKNELINLLKLQKINININFLITLVYLAGIFEILSTIIIFVGINNIINIKFAKYTIICLIIFTIFATIIFHNPILEKTTEKIGIKLYHLLKNMSIIGGLWSFYDIV